MMNSKITTESTYNEPSNLAKNCCGCNQVINDQFMLSIMNSHWHESCLTCCICNCNLIDTCYYSNEKANMMRLYCKNDYFNVFGLKCNACFKPIDHNQMVIRCNERTLYHKQCFKCSICQCNLNKGDKFSILSNKIYCEYDYETFNYNKDSNNNTTSTQESLTSHEEDNNDNSDDDDDDSSSLTCKRPRTILTSSQRRKFRDIFTNIQKPCRKLREQLALETGLSVRVVQVWFQNERAKMKKLQRKQLPFAHFEHEFDEFPLNKRSNKSDKKSNKKLKTEIEDNSNEIQSESTKKDFQTSPNSELSSTSYNSVNKLFQNNNKPEETKSSNEYFLLKNVSQNYLLNQMESFYPMHNLYIYEKM